jgi:hypothetical protein
VERTSSRAGVAPAEVQRLVTAHFFANYRRHSSFLDRGIKPRIAVVGLFALASIVRMLILGAGYLYLRLGSPREERPPLDERDRAIEHRSISAAYYVLIAGMILVGCFMPFSSTGWTIVNAAIFWIVAAEVVHYSVVVASYRVQASS